MELRGHIDENGTLHDRQIAHTESYTHIGIDRKLRGHDLIEKSIKPARRTTYALMGTGMHGYNGINPSVIIHMWNQECYLDLTVYYLLRRTTQNYRHIINPF